MPSPIHRAIHVAALACLSVGCAQLVGSSDVGLESEAKLGAEVAQQVEATMGIVESPALGGYVTRIGNRLAGAADSTVEFHFAVVDAPEPNAFALPGGYVFVSRGLLALLGSEDELAGVIGHEIGHVMARHHVQSLLRNAPLAPVRLATGLGGAVASIVSPTIGKTIAGAGKVTTGLVAAPYNRDQEREADRLGQRFAAEAGWDPAALAAVMHALGRELELHGGDASRVSILATHPASEERRKSAIENAKTLAPAAAASGASTSSRRDFLLKLEGLLVGRGAAGGAFDGDDFLHPGMGLAITFPPGWQQVNTDSLVGASDAEKKAAVVLQLEGEGDDPLEVARAARLESGRLEAPPRPTKLGGKRAAWAMARSSQGRARVTWVAHNDLVFRLSAGAPTARFSQLESTLRRSVESFRDLSPSDRGRIREDRLTIVRAGGGDQLGDVLERHGSRWKVEAAAVANGLQVDEPLTAGQPIKITVPTVYERRRDSK